MSIKRAAEVRVNWRQKCFSHPSPVQRLTKLFYGTASPHRISPVTTENKLNWFFKPSAPFVSALKSLS
jgi:hypothetical protein